MFKLAGEVASSHDSFGSERVSRFPSGEFGEGGGGGADASIDRALAHRATLRACIEDGCLPSETDHAARFHEAITGLLAARDFVRPHALDPRQIAAFYAEYQGTFNVSAASHLPKIFPNFVGPTLADLERLKKRDGEEPSKSYSYGTMPWAETAVLREIVRALRPRTILEIGTNIGILTKEVLDASPVDTVLFTLDLPPSQRGSAAQPIDAVNLSYVGQLKGDEDVGREYKTHPRSAQVIQLLGDSQRFDFSPLQGTIDLVIVDGHHAYPAPYLDSKRALELVSPGGVVAWDDYGKLFRLEGVTLALLELAVKEGKRMYYVNHAESLSTGLVFHIAEPA